MVTLFLALIYLKIVAICRKSKCIASQTLTFLHEKIYFKKLYKNRRLGPILWNIHEERINLISDVMFAQQYCWIFKSSQMWHFAVKYVGADDLKELPHLGLLWLCRWRDYAPLKLGTTHSTTNHHLPENLQLINPFAY
jgi:hypothetical protein